MRCTHCACARFRFYSSLVESVVASSALLALLVYLESSKQGGAHKRGSAHTVLARWNSFEALSFLLNHSQRVHNLSSLPELMESVLPIDQVLSTKLQSVWIYQDLNNNSNNYKNTIKALLLSTCFLTLKLSMLCF